jgi:hypothetical protein
MRFPSYARPVGVLVRIQIVGLNAGFVKKAFNGIRVDEDCASVFPVAP